MNCPFKETRKRLLGGDFSGLFRITLKGTHTKRMVVCNEKGNIIGFIIRYYTGFNRLYTNFNMAIPELVQ